MPPERRTPGRAPTVAAAGGFAPRATGCTMTAALLSALAVTGTACDEVAPAPMRGTDAEMAVDASADAGTVTAYPPDAGEEAEPQGVADAGTAMDAASDCPRVRVVTPGEVLNVRSAPSVSSDIVTTLVDGTVVVVDATVDGDPVDGEREWHEIDTGVHDGFVSGRFATCTSEQASFRPFDGFRLPLECETSARISQGNNSSFSHQGLSAYAFDFSLARGTTLHAMADGVASLVKDDTKPGDPCYDGGGPECVSEANIVHLRHADGTVTSYAHLDAALVEVGESVRSGMPVGRSGSSGYSTGPHAHVAREEACGGLGCQSIPMSFLDVEGDGVPETDDVVTSGNCDP